LNYLFLSGVPDLKPVEENQIGGNRRETLQNDATLLDVRPGVRSGPTYHGERWSI